MNCHSGPLNPGLDRHGPHDAPPRANPTLQFELGFKLIHPSFVGEGISIIQHHVLFLAVLYL